MAPTNAEHWDARYRAAAQLFSGDPNGVLVAEVAGLPPARALDVGCGEGGDARWLARRGWQVIGVDVAAVALGRAAAAAAADGPDVASRIRWVRADLLARPDLEVGAFDLVSVQYFPLPRSSGRGPSPALRALLDAVAPGGLLLLVGHELTAHVAREHDIDPADLDQPADVARMLDDRWTVLVDERRPRTVAPPPGSHHTHDTVLLARRRR